MTRTTDPLSMFGTKSTPQTQQIPGRTDQVKNNAGGFVFEIDRFAQLRRFLTMGTAGGTYYVGQDQLTRENGELIIALTNNPADHLMMVDIIEEISVAGRAPKPNPALFALAIACQLGEPEGKKYARSKINAVVRTGTHLFDFIGYLEQFGGIGRGLRTALGKWYTEKDVDKLSLQLIKYRQRSGWTHRDVLRKAHPKVEGPGKRAAIDWAVGKKTEDGDNLPDFIRFFEMANIEGADIPGLLKSTYLPWEALPDSAMNDPRVWKVMIDNGMPITALVRQLSRLTRMGLLDPMDDGSGRTNDVVLQLTNAGNVEKSRIHPIQVLQALYTYKSGVGERNTWTPVPKVIDALDDMFYMSFKNVVPTNKRTMLAIDASDSMTWPQNVPPKSALNCRELAAALAMVTVKTETNSLVTAFSAGKRLPGQGYYGVERNSDGIETLPISGRQRLDDVVSTISNVYAGGTDCSLPMRYAQKKGLKVDTFIIYTDNETHSGFMGSGHVTQALADYRKSSGINAKLIVAAMTPTKFSIADPKDPSGQLDISGFDSATPGMIADFSRGDI